MSRLVQVVVIAAIFAAIVFSRPVFADTVSIVPSSPTVSPGGTFTVDVNISGATDLYDFGFDLYFNPAVINVTNVLEGTFLPSGGPTFFIPGTIDNTGGSVTFNADTLEGPPPGVNGDGTLIVFDFSALKSGASTLTLDPKTLILQDSTGALIDSTVKNGAVTVEGKTSVPEPSILLMLGVGLLSLAGLTLKKSQ